MCQCVNLFILGANKSFAAFLGIIFLKWTVGYTTSMLFLKRSKK